MLTLLASAFAEPLYGSLEIPHGREVELGVGIEVFPVTGAGGSVAPELSAGVGLGHGFDLRAAAGVDVPVYAVDDGRMTAPYSDPEVAFVDVAARWTRSGADPVHPQDRFSAGLRVSNRPFDRRAGGADAWGFGPELAWSWHLDGVRVLFRPAFLTQPGYWPDGFGQLSLGASVVVPVRRVDLFVDAEPKAWFLVQFAAGPRGGEFAVQPTLEARLGARFHLGEPHTLVVAAIWAPDSVLSPEENFAAFVGYQLTLGHE